MQVLFQFDLDDYGTNYFLVEADVTPDVSIGCFSLDTEINSVQLNGCMSILLKQIPAELKNQIIDKAEKEWNKQKEMQNCLTQREVREPKRSAAWA